MNFQLSYTDATVLHSNIYNQRVGLVIGWFVFNNLQQSVTFRLLDTGEEISTIFRNTQFPLYPGQTITLLSINDKVIAYTDRNTGDYYYFSNNLQQDLGYGVQFTWRFVFALTLLFFVVLAEMPETIASYSMLAFLLPFGFWIYRRITNFFLERSIDRLITNG